MHSIEEIIAASKYRDSVQRFARVGSARIGVSDMTWTTGRMDNLPPRYSALALYRSPARIRHSIAGEDRPTRCFVEGDLMLRAPGLAYATEYEDAVDLTVFALETELVQSMTTNFNADVGAAFSRLEARPFRSPLVEGLAKQLAAAARAGADRLYADALSLALVHELWRMTQGDLHPSETAPGALTERQMRQIDEAVAAAAGRPVTLEALADLTAMSLTAFSAAMKATTGQTPYQYVLSRRMAAARDLIETTGLPLSQIAFRCGFSSQSHMTDVFRAKIGTTPGKLRRAGA